MRTALFAALGFFVMLALAGVRTAAVRCLARLDMLLVRTALRAFTVARVRSSRRGAAAMRLFAGFYMLLM